MSVSESELSELLTSFVSPSLDSLSINQDNELSSLYSRLTNIFQDPSNSSLIKQIKVPPQKSKYSKLRTCQLFLQYDLEKVLKILSKAKVFLMDSLMQESFDTSSLLDYLNEEYYFVVLPLLKDNSHFEKFVNFSLLKFPNGDKVSLMHSYIALLNQEQISEFLAAAMLKLKANPESSLDTIASVVKYMNKKYTVDNMEISKVAQKFVIHSKKEMRHWGSVLLGQLGCMNSSIVAELALLLENKTDVKVTTAEHRLGVYQALTTIAQQQNECTAHSQVLETIVNVLKKETGSAKEAANLALLYWMQSFKNSSEAESSSKGYEMALSYLAEPIQNMNTGNNVISSEVKFRLGNLMKSMEYSSVHAILLNMIALLNKKKADGDAFIKGLKAIVDAAMKKYKNSKLVAQSDGLLCLYILLLSVQEQGLTSVASMEKALGVNVCKVLTGDSSDSFLYGQAMMDSFSTDTTVQQLLHRSIALYTKLMHIACDLDSKSFKGIVCLKKNTVSAAADAIAACVVQTCSENVDVESSIKTLLTYASSQDCVGDALVKASFDYANGLETQAIDATRVRSIASILYKETTSSDAFTNCMVLAHAGTLPNTDDEELAEELESTVTDMILGSSLDLNAASAAVADRIVVCGAMSKENEDATINIGKFVHTSTLGLITTLGKIAGTFDEELTDPDEEESKACIFSWNLCVKELANKVAIQLSSAREKIEDLSAEDVGLYYSKEGELYVPKNVITKDQNKGKKLSEDEEWELQVKKDLAAKKNQDAVPGLSSEDKGKIEEQTTERNRIKNLVECNFTRSLSMVQAICMSDIEVGNSILSVMSLAVTLAAISNSEILSSELLKKASYDTICKLAECVYEIDEEVTEDVAKALILVQKRVKDSDAKNLVEVVPFPAKCDEASIIIAEMEDYGDTLSGNSFVFLFPIIRAALTGPRTSSGCEDAPKILERHAELIDVDGPVKNLRKDIGAAVLELLSHDRSIAYKEPTPTEALVAVYTTGKKPATSELAPLLSESGALGVKNCRIASMTTLAAIIEAHPKLLKTNPVVENRIFVNCFAKDEDIKAEAVRAWKLANNVNDDDDELPAPSKIYSVALVPLLSHKNKDIAKAAAAAYAFGIQQYPDAAEKSFNRLFTAYIDSYATTAEGTSKDNAGLPIETTPALPSAPVAAAPKKKKAPKLDIGTVKKKSVQKKKGGSIMASLTKTAATKKKKKTPSAISSFAPKKKERTIDQDDLMSQFAPVAALEKKLEEKDTPDKISIRSGVLEVLDALSSSSSKVQLDVSHLKLLVGFLMAYGLADINDNVRSTASSALRDCVASDSAKEAMDFLLPLLEKTLKDGKADTSCLGSLPTEKVLDDTNATDHRKEGVVIALGSAAIHLDDKADVDKINETLKMLINALSTPSESVQASVALCVAKLMKKGDLKTQTETLLEEQLNECLHGKSLASRRGAAYGISAIVKGSGIASLKKFSVVKQLEEACNDGTASTKEGALFAIELLSARLGLLFEPYVIVLLPALLKSFSDSSDHVRNAAKNSVGLIMSKLSGHGVKLLVPAVLAGLEEDDWRTKQASIHMLGSMSHCAPKQLASCLPNIVPKLTEAFSDTHPKVKSSASSSLSEISKVIRNPEISEIASSLLNALTDPSTTVNALESLIETEFLHAIDAASLSLIVPVIHRGLRDRAATTKRYGALIAGNIVTMINNPKDFVPYLPILLPDLKSVLLDPIPDCRSISAKAIGSLTRSLGEATFPDLRPWLVETLRGESGTSVERSGAAQGLTELLCAGGTGLVNEVMKEDILPLIDHPKACTREGVLWVLTFLPSSLGQAFAPLIDVSFPALISGLSDENESVRDVAMRAGRVTIRSHGKAHIDKILPSLEDGLGNEDYRIRAASLNLLGDLLATLAGTRVSKGDVDTQEDIRQAEKAQAQIALALGPDTRKRVLSGLYLRRSDTTAVVRQAAVMVWKSVVSVTPRTLREILDALVELIVNALASGHPDHTQVAGRCLGDIVSKLGDAVLPEIMPILSDALHRGDVHTRLGACVGLTEVIACSTKEQITKYLDILVKVVDEALCDDDEEVRKMAATCFQNLYNEVGNKAFDEIVPQLLAAMEGSDEDSRARAVNGITGILSVRSKELLPYLISRLIKKRPITANQAAALGSISSVTGHVIHSYFGTIIPNLLAELTDLFDEELDEEDKTKEEAIRRCFSDIASNVAGPGVNVLIGEVASKCGSDKEGTRKEGCWMMQTIVEERKDLADFYEQIPIILRELLYRLNDESKKVLVATNAALAVLSKHVPAEELVNHVEFISNLLASMVSDARRRKGGVGDGEFLLPGFNMPKGLEPLLPIYQRGILYGDASIREVSAAGLGELINITATKFLAGPFIIKVTGPLLRIVGDRNPSAVKIAIIKTLGLILSKGGPALRAFVPQFQTTFLKALSDPSRQVRIEAIKAFALLMPLSTRLDPLIKELVSTSLGNGAASSLDSTAGVVAIQTATLEALAIVLKYGGRKAKLPTSIPSALDAGKEMLFHEDDGVRTGAAKVIGAACELTEIDEVNEVAATLLAEDDASPEYKHGKASLVHYLLASSAGKSLLPDIVGDMANFIKTSMSDDTSLVREAACTASGAIIGSVSGEDTNKFIALLKSSIIKNLDPKESIEILKSTAKGLAVSAQLNSDLYVNKNSLPLLDAALQCSMKGQQRVQLAFNDFLWLALDVENGESGIYDYCNLAMFENSKKMKQLYTKVLTRIKGVDVDGMA